MVRFEHTTVRPGQWSRLLYPHMERAYQATRELIVALDAPRDPQVIRLIQRSLPTLSDAAFDTKHMLKTIEPDSPFCAHRDLINGAKQFASQSAILADLFRTNIDVLIPSMTDVLIQDVGHYWTWVQEMCAAVEQVPRQYR